MQNVLKISTYCILGMLHTAQLPNRCAKRTANLCVIIFHETYEKKN